MNKKFFVILVGLFISVIGLAQPTDSPRELLQLLEGKRNYEEIVAIKNDYLNRIRAEMEANGNLGNYKSLVKKWIRWELYNQERLDEKGNLVNMAEWNYNLIQQQSSTANVDEGIETLATGNASWTTLGPLDRTRIGSGHNSGLGRVNCIAFHPSNVNTFYIGCPAGGVWKTTNGGTSWISVSDMLPTLGISGIVVSWANGNTVYALTGDGDGGHMAGIGVIKSNDAGVNWFRTGNFPGLDDKSFFGYKLIQHPTESQTLFAATTAGIFRTLNGGTTWTLVAEGSISDIEFKPGDPTIMYAVRRNSSFPFLRSINTGDSWRASGVTGVPTIATRICIGVTPANANYVYLLAGPATGSGMFVGVYRSTNSGLEFTQRAITPNVLGYPTDGSDNRDQTGYDLALEVSRTNANNIVTGGINLWGSTNGGTTLTYRTQWFDDAPGEYVHADIHNLAYNPLNNRLYVTSDGGVAYSDNDGTNWTRIWTGLNIMQFYHMTGKASDANLLIGGTQDNGTNYRKSNTSNYHHIEGGDGYSAIIDWNNSNICYFSENENLNKTTNGGTSATGIKPPGSGDSWPMVVQHPTVPDTIYAGYSNGVYKSANGGTAWINMGASGNTELHIAPTNGRRLFAVSGNNARKTENGGNNWASVTANPGFPSARNITDMCFSPNTSNTLVICVGGLTAGQKVYRSTNFGENWTNLSYDLPNAPATAIAMDAAGHIYVGTDIGVFVLKSGNNKWTPFFNFLPKSPINDLEINAGAGVIRAATFGRGIWETELFGACPANLTVSNTVYNSRYWQASSNITSTQVVTNSPGIEVAYSAGNTVLLNPGFQSVSGSTFKAYIANCDAGIPIMSVLSTDFAITEKSELLVHDFAPLTQPIDMAAYHMKMINTAEGTQRVQMNIPKPANALLYLERQLDGEVLAFFFNQPIKAGQYEMTLNLNKFKGQGVHLKWYSNGVSGKVDL